MCFFAKKKSTVVEHKYSQEESETPKVSEPAAAYKVSEKRKVFSEEELSHGIPVEESRRRLTEIIHNHYHQQ